MFEYDIQVEFDEKNLIFSFPDHHDIVSATKVNEFDLHSSFGSGVSISCASMVLNGSVEQKNYMGLNYELWEKSFVFLFDEYPKSDLLIIILDEVEDNLYNDQLGKYQR